MRLARSMGDNRGKNRPEIPAVDKALANVDSLTGLFLRRWRVVWDSYNLCYLVSKLIMVNIGDQEIILIRVWATDIMDVHKFPTPLSLFLALVDVIALWVNIRREPSNDRIVGSGTGIWGLYAMDKP